MHPKTFTDYALSGELSADETYTVELLIDHVRMDFDPNYWNNWSERTDARKEPGYQPWFDPNHVELAERELQKLTWVSLQRTHGKNRPVRDITALRYLTGLTGLSLGDNEIKEIVPLAACVNLKRLHLKENHIRDISALANCRCLEWLDVGSLPIEDLLPIRDLPLLRELEISYAQLPVFSRMGQQLALRKLDISHDDLDNLMDGFDSFEGFPYLPELRSIRGAKVKSLDGLEKFPKLQNLVNLSGEFASLEPLCHLKALTHANILSSNINSLEPLGGLYALRDLWIETSAKRLDLLPLDGLPALHEVTVKCDDEEPESLSKLRQSLDSWDVEFRSPTPRHTPSAQLEVVDDEVFSYYDTREKFNISEIDENEMLLSSEQDWLNQQLGEWLSVGFAEEEDYYLPNQLNESRSTTVVLLSDMALESLPKIIDSIQQILSYAKKDWIIYLQADGTSVEFSAWIYPFKVMVTKQHLKVMQKLMERP